MVAVDVELDVDLYTVWRGGGNLKCGGGEVDGGRWTVDGGRWTRTDPAGRAELVGTRKDG